MALFNKNKEDSERDRILGQEIKNIRYVSLTEALEGEISINSKDAKITYFTFPNERVFTVISASGQVLLARDSERPVDLTSYLYWSDLSETSKSNVLVLASGNPLNEGIIGVVNSRVPEATPTLKKAIYDTTLEALKVIFDEFGTYETIDTEIYKNNEVVKLLSNQGFDLDTVETTVIAAQNRAEELERLLGIAVGYSYAKLSETQLSPGELITPEDKLVYAAANADATIEDTLVIASGFRWVTVLQKIHDLVEAGIISIEIDAPFEALPDSFEILHPYEKLFRLTHELSSELEPLVERVFDISGDRELALKLAQDNATLELRVLEVEDMLIRKLKGEVYDDFQDLDAEIQDSVRVLILDRESANEKRTAILTRLKALTLDDTETIADDQLRELIGLKLVGIEVATNKLPHFEPDLSNNHFDVPDEEPSFNFNDARLIQNSEGEFQVEEIETHEGLDEDEDALAIHELVHLVNSEAEPVVPNELDLDQLDSHLSSSFTSSRRRKRAFRATELLNKELDGLSD